MIDFFSVVAGDAVLGQRLPDRPSERCEFVNISQRQFERVIVHEEEPVPSPGHVTDDRTVSRHVDANVGRTPIAGNIVDGHFASGIEGSFDFSHRRLDAVGTGHKALQVSERGDESDGAVAAHAQISDVVKEDDAGSAVAINWFAQESADNDVGTAGLGYDGRSEGIVILAKPFQPLCERSGSQVGATGNHEAGWLSSGVGVDHSNFSMPDGHSLSYRISEDPMTLSSQFSRRNFMTTVAAAAGSTLLPRMAGASPLQDPIVDTISKGGKTVSQERIRWKVLPFPLTQVRLGDGPCKIAMEADRKYLLSLPPDRLLHTFRVNAGIASSAQPLGGWEKPDCELRGHYAGGHYLSACALMYASTGDEDLKKNANLVVTGLGQCQAKSGYLSAFPVEFFDRLRERQEVWAPFYTIHKIMAGLLDVHLYCGNAQALDMVEKMAEWTDLYTESLSYEHMQRVLGTEFGGMGEVLGNLYAVTGKEEYLEVARRFDKNRFFEPLASHRDELKGLHVNTHVPQVIAAARLYELTGDRRYRDIAEYFWDEVVSERSYCTGGTSNNESWNTDPGKLSTELGPSTTECCCAYNMMKLTRHLFGWSPDARLMDYYERTLFNHRLGTIDPEDGMMMYYLPLASGYWKTFGRAFDSFWCCTGTGSEEYAKLADTIYFHDENSLYVNLYIDSQLEWPEKGLRFKQETRFPEEQGTTITVSGKTPTRLAVQLRVPYWAEGGSVKINGTPLQAFSSPSSYLTLNREWRNGDKIELSLPMKLHIDAMPDDPSMQAVMYGPLVLAGRFDAVAKEKIYEDLGPRHEQAEKVPEIVANWNDSTGWMEPDASQRLVFRSVGQSQPITMVPLNSIFHEHYAVYWKVNSKT